MKRICLGTPFPSSSPISHSGTSVQPSHFSIPSSSAILTNLLSFAQMYPTIVASILVKESP